jgi:RNA polymerase II subunit A small phosphatase-like protein/ubiquitin-like domain-containing CTD phosphatase 1
VAPQPARPLLVLDLDETLWHGDDTAQGLSFALRPSLGEFLRQVAEHYDLAVWTSASGEWMQAGLVAVQAETGFDLAGQAFFLWDRSRCSLRRLEDGEYGWHKPARKFRAGWIRARYPRERILALDDVAENYTTGYGHLVRISAWTGQPDDRALRDAARYLVSIADEPDLRALEKRGWASRTRPEG